MNANTRDLYFGYDRREVVRFLPASCQRVLEIGCGEGQFSKYIRSSQEYWAIEPNLESSRIAAQRIPRVLCGTFDSCRAHLPDGHFDLVICNDVIEHMPDHASFLDQIRLKMNRGAFLVGSVPNVRYITNLFDLLIRRDWPYTDCGVLDRTHLRFFTERSLRRSLEEHGFVIEALVGINSVIRRPKTLMDIARTASALGVIAATLGHAGDVRFFQFGFRARLD